MVWRVAAVAAGLTLAWSGSALASPGTGGGVAVLPAVGDRHASRTGTHLELGLLRPGAVLHGSVRVVNSSAAPVTVDLYGADGVPAVNGGVGFTARTEAPHRVGSWIRLAASRVVVPAGATRQVAYTLTAGAPASGADEVGAIVAEPLVAESAGLRSVTRFAMGVYLRLPGRAAPSSVSSPVSSPGARPPVAVPPGVHVVTPMTSRVASRWPWILLALLLVLIVGSLDRRARRRHHLQESRTS
jgi:hypothetical protein